MNKRKKAFTLIELLVVIVIIGILATISTATFNGAIEKARLAKAQSMAAQMKTQFLAENIVSKNPLFTGWYAFEDGEVSQTSPFVLDKSEAGYDILYNLSSAATFSQSDDTGTGSGKSLEVIGGTLYAGDFSSQTPVINKITIGIWVKMLDLSSLTDATFPVHINGNRFGFRAYPDGKAGLYISNNSIDTEGPILDDGQWHYLLGSYDGDTQDLKLWVDGDLAASGNLPMTIPLETGQIRIGFLAAGRTPNMRIDDIMILPLAFDGEEFK